MPSFERVWMIFSRSSTAIWWVSLSESLEIDVRILCFSSIMAKWVESDEDEDDDDDLEGGADDDWFVVFEGFDDLGT